VQGGPAMQVTKRNGGEAFESPDGKFVYYAMIDTPGIWKVPTEGGEETQVLGQGGESLWVLAEGGIVFFYLKNPDGPTLNLFSFSTRKTTLLRQFPKAPKVAGGGNVLSVSPDGRWILYTQAEQSGSDLMLVENFR
jgi:Tol biopolymer transport system component